MAQIARHGRPPADVTARLPLLVLLTTGGTIAARAASPDSAIHYRFAPDLDPDLLQALEPVAALRQESVARMPSSDLGAQQLPTLAARVAHHRADPAVDGIVITHGAHTLEETALFLALVTPPGKPVVLTAAMRPLAARLVPMARVPAGGRPRRPPPAAKDRGVLVAMDHQVIAAPSARKRHTAAASASRPDAEGFLGQVLPARIAFVARTPASPLFHIAEVTGTPRVDILFSHQDMAEDLFDAVIAGGARGLAPACTGNGTRRLRPSAAWHGRSTPASLVARSSCTRGA